AVPVSAVSMFAFIAALKFTTVANVMIVYATVPLVAAAIALVWLGELVTRRTVIASLVALLGIVVMAGAAARLEDLAGDALSLLMTVTFAGLVVMARRHPTLSMVAVNAPASLLCALLLWPLMPAGLPGADQLLIL